MGMEKYLSNYGWHFSKAMAEWAISMMKDFNGHEVSMMSKDRLDSLLDSNGISMSKSVAYDAMYVAHMLRADFSCAESDSMLAKMVGEYMNDKDGYDGKAFNRFYADTIAKGIPIVWVDML